MKYLLFIIGIVLFTISCDKQIQENEKSFESNTALSRATDAPKGIGITCKGTCDCGLVGIYSDGNHFVECTCDDCVMNITFHYSNKEVVSTLENSKFEVDFISEFEQYITEEYLSEEYVIHSIQIEQSESGSSYLFDYSVNDVDDTVMFATYGDKKFKIKCDGSCGCRERFVYSDPPSSECTCDDCVMEVTQLKSTPSNG